MPARPSTTSGLAGFIRECAHEVSLFWEHPVYGFLCKARPDIFDPERQIIGDLKTTADASPEAFRLAIARLRYHWQAAWYMEGAKALFPKMEWRDFLFIAIEKEPPFGIGAYILDEQALYVGQEQIKALLSDYANCIATNSWKAYHQGIVSLSLPTWATIMEE